MNILVIGDWIEDHYKFCKAVRLCPEAPAPVLHVVEERESPGGAGLVEANLRSLMTDGWVNTVYGSVSRKLRIFADRTLVCRVDEDSRTIINSAKHLIDQIAGSALPQVDAIVVSDYGKGTMMPEVASYILGLGKPVFVDAKHDVEKYKGCFAIFPNEHEHPTLDPKDYGHVIRKLGPKGCSVDGELVSTEEQQVYDVTGAGDVFLATFVWTFLSWKGPELDKFCSAAHLANMAAGISVRHLGTYVITRAELGLQEQGEKANA